MTLSHWWEQTGNKEISLQRLKQGKALEGRAGKDWDLEESVKSSYGFSKVVMCFYSGSIKVIWSIEIRARKQREDQMKTDICIYRKIQHCHHHQGNVKDHISALQRLRNGLIWSVCAYVCVCHNCTVSSLGKAFVFHWQPIKRSHDDPSVSLH